MTISRAWRQWTSPPLVVQFLALLIGALVVAQLVTLLLTLVLPPEPPRRYEIGDIARALRGAGTERPLARHVEPGPPDLSARGWLVSPTTKSELAHAVGLPADRIVFGYYTALPIAGLAGAPPPLPRPPADARPAQIGAESGTLPQRWTAGLAMLSRLPSLALTWAVPPASAQQAAPTGGGPGGGAALGRRGEGTPGFGTLGGGAGRMGNPGPGGMRGGSEQGRSGPGGIGSGGIAGGRGDMPMATRAERLRAQMDRLQPAAPAAQREQGASRTPDAMSATRLAPGVAGPPGRAAGSTAIRPAYSTGWLPAPVSLAAPLATPRATATATRTPVDPPAAAVPVVSPRALAARPVPTATARPVAAPAVAAPAPRITARRPPVQIAIPVPIVRPSAGLFGLADAPFVEGDFIAAARRADGRWVTVTPIAEGFPNAWQRRVLLWFGLSLLAVAPIAWLFARHIVGPLKGFADAAERLGRDPSAAILPLDGPAEVGRAAHAFNQMGSRLRSFVDDRTAMIGAISHDLRTPLTRLRFRIEDVPDDQHAGLLGEVEAMEAMISSVIAYMRDAATPGVRERRDLAELVGDVVEDAALIGGDVRTVRAEPAPVDIDALGVRRVLDNLLTNAIKYGGGVARVALRVEDACAVADIVDDGPGIPDAEIERVFEPFYRSEAARASSREGSGLGLAVCRSIARAHGGDVRLFRSAAGFTARVTLPLAYDGERQLAA